ncbi:ATP-binding protein [Streptomyces sp. NPDC090298]|uniref:HD domain-containing protein n=1 Tax=Streptomyces sp. NPDC090298 TaxID=3365959 RepID=UPI0037FE04CE
MTGGTYLGPVFQARSVHVTLQEPSQAADPGAAVPGAADPWLRAAAGSSVWDHVPATRDVEAVRAHASAVVLALAALRDEASAVLGDDPWQDPGMPERFLERVEWLLGEPDPDAPLDLYPAEAALLVLVPFLHRVDWLRTAARYAAVEPSRLERVPDAGDDRLSFEAFTEENDRLVTRAALRPEATAPIGWWLFHRWTLRRGLHADPVAVRELLALVCEPTGPLGDVLGAGRVARLLHGVRRGPDVAHAEFLEQLRSDDRVRSAGPQRVRERRLVLLTALAYGTCLDMVALPDIVVEHLGIPHPVDLGLLLDTLEGATWGGQAALPVLRADCHHEAVIEGLRDHTARADEILHAVHRATREWITQPMPALPTRLSADDVRPADGVFDGWAAFRLDERRVRELLMGVQLYKDRDLAVRELYQNALDACRYRRARTEYLNRAEGHAHSYEGRITFEQGVDETGRAYLECRDDGIGMGDAELRGVFSQAGARFAEQTDFKLERAAWEALDPPVELFPNSRFGIGVLSYFMLADELTVTTCRMGLNGAPGPLLQVSVHGPGHLFRIARLAERGDRPGTRVRLYLRGATGTGDGWSCVDVLERLLGIAEFGTSASHGDRHAEWQPGRLPLRKAPDRERFGLDTHGERVHCPDPAPGVSVTWTEHGGGLLVDGLVVQSVTQAGVLSSAPSGLTGVVVNLSGAHAPGQLSADRAQVLDDLAPFLRDVLTGAADVLATCRQALLNFTWVCRIARHSPLLADLLTQAAVRAGKPIGFGLRSLDPTRTGILPSDADMFLEPPGHGEEEWSSWDVLGKPPEHIHLWRLLAHGPRRILEELSEFCPELLSPGPVLPAVPSDLLLLASPSDSTQYWHWNGSYAEEGRYTEAIREWGLDPRAATDRAARLGLPAARPEGLPPGAPGGGGVPTAAELADGALEGERTPAEVAATWRAGGVDVPDEVVLLAQGYLEEPEFLLRYGNREASGWFAAGETVPPGRLAQASAELGLTVAEVCARYRRFGLPTDEQGLADRPAPGTEVILREFCQEKGAWLTRPCVLAPEQILRAADHLDVEPSEAERIYGDLGFVGACPLPSDATVDDLALFGDEWMFYDDWFTPPGPLPYGLLLEAVGPQRPLAHVVARFRAYGFVVPLRAPDTLDDLDAILLSTRGPCSWWGVGTDDPMPFAHVLEAAHTTFRRPEELAARLVSYGVPLSCDGLPDGLTFDASRRLLKRDGVGGDEKFLRKDSEVSLPDLLQRARNVGAPVGRVVAWLGELGIPVPDLTLILRRSLDRVPRP